MRFFNTKTTTIHEGAGQVEIVGKVQRQPTEPRIVRPYLSAFLHFHKVSALKVPGRDNSDDITASIANLDPVAVGLIAVGWVEG
ncbi:MAG: hypothetical protein ABJN40_13380 [Sneathiella sp.]